MKMIRINVPILACVLLVLAGAQGAQAQAIRTWVSGVGDDANPCSRTAPCKTFAGAISKTAAGGEISVLDNGAYGAVTITKSITINGDGSLASTLVTLGSSGIIINAGVNDKVILRNISIIGAGTGANGIRFLAGRQLTVDNVTINGFTTRGIDVSLSAGGSVTVEDTTITNCATGIRVATTSGFAQAILDNVNLMSMTTGLEAANNSFIMVRGSTITSNGMNGVLASAATGTANVESSTVAFNGTGINASVSGSRIRISGNGIYNNSTGVAFAAGATVESDNSNRVAGNGASALPNGVITLD